MAIDPCEETRLQTARISGLGQDEVNESAIAGGFELLQVSHIAENKTTFGRTESPRWSKNGTLAVLIFGFPVQECEGVAVNDAQSRLIAQSHQLSWMTAPAGRKY
jgi:hypothetical protein